MEGIFVESFLWKHPTIADGSKNVAKNLPNAAALLFSRVRGTRTSLGFHPVGSMQAISSSTLFGNKATGPLVSGK